MNLKKLMLSCGVFCTILVIGVAGIMAVESLSFLDALYFVVVSMATVGYGDIVPSTPLGKIFAIFLIITGFGTAYYTFTLIITMIIEGQLTDILGRRGMRRRIAGLNGHIIVCGAGSVGINVVERLQDEKQPFVVIEQDQEKCSKLMDKNVLVINGDATLDEVLLEAGVKKAAGVIAALSHDADNVYVTLTAKSLNPEISIVARAARPEAEEKLHRAGAKTVIFPSVMGGRQLVTALTKPVIMDFVENLFYNQELHMDIAEIKVNEISPLAGKAIADSGIKERYNSIVVAIKRGETLITNPKAKEVISGGDILIVLGQRGQLNELNDAASDGLPLEG